MKIDEKEFDELYRKECFLGQAMSESRVFVISELLLKIADQYCMPAEQVGQAYNAWKATREKKDQN